MITATSLSPIQGQPQPPKANAQVKPEENKVGRRPSQMSIARDSYQVNTPQAGMANVISLFPPSQSSPARQTRPTPSQPAIVKPAVEPPSEQEIQWALQLENKVKEGYQPTPQEVDVYQSIAKRLQASQQEPSPVNTTTIPHYSYGRPLTLVEAQWAEDMAQKIESGYYQPTHREMKNFMELSEQALQEKNNEIFTQWPASVKNPPDSDELRWALSVTRDFQFGEKPNTRQLKHFAQVARIVLSAHLEATKPQSSGKVSQAELQWALDLQNKVQQGYSPSEQEVQKYQDIYERYEQKQSYPMPPQPYPGGGGPYNEPHIQWMEPSHPIEQPGDPFGGGAIRLENPSPLLQKIVTEGAFLHNKKAG